MKAKTNTMRPKEIDILGTKYKIFFYDSEECDPKMEGEEIHTLFFYVKKL